jgi:hypothetical protein
MIESIAPMTSLSTNLSVAKLSSGESATEATGLGDDMVLSAQRSADFMRASTAFSAEQVRETMDYYARKQSAFSRKGGVAEQRALTKAATMFGQDVSELKTALTGKGLEVNAQLAAVQHTNLQIKIDTITGVLKKSADFLQKITSMQ